jgi:hypothetical protein
MMINAANAETAMDRDWVAYTKGLLRAEMVKRGVSYAQLVERLAAIGVQDSEANLRNKISRGGFTASFMIQCLTALGVRSLRLEDAD